MVQNNNVTDSNTYFIPVVHKAAEKHIEHVKIERAHYKQACEDSVKEVERLFSEGIPPPGAKIPPNTSQGTIHYSFDMAQQVN